MKNILLTIAFATISFASSWAQTKNFIDQPYLETTAKVDTMVVPDRIYLNILITEKDTKGKVSVEELESKMESALKALGIDTKKRLSLNDLASNFKKYFLKRQDVLKAKSYTLVVEDAIMAGKAIVTLEQIDISNVSFEKTEFSKIDQLRMDLKSKAIIKAKKQAESLTTPLGQKVGNAIFISDMTDVHAFRTFEGRASGIQIRGYAAKQDFKPADIEFEKIKVESTINVKFTLL